MDGLGKGVRGRRLDVPEVFVLGDGCLDAGGQVGEGGGVGGGEGGAVLVAGLFGLVGEGVRTKKGLGKRDAWDNGTLRKRVRAALASFSRPL